MKVFWSWQSDHPGKISRHFIRAALEQAISEINQDTDIDESQREATLDHDRKDVPGSPDLASIILEKIRASDVFVGDVSAVGTTGKKKLINSNVAIELGFALCALTDRRLIMIMNEHFGSREDLPFDLKHKAGPIIYRLGPDASKKQIEVAQVQLAANLKVALKAMQPFGGRAVQEFVPAPSIPRDKSRFATDDQEIVPPQNRNVTKFFIPETPLLYLRVLPTTQLLPMKRADALRLVRQGPKQLEPFYCRPSGSSYEANQFGALAFDANWQTGEVLCGAQLFLSRELWAFDAVMCGPNERKTHGIPWLAAEQAYADRLPKYVRFAAEQLAVPFPIRVIAGVVGVRGYTLHFRSNLYGWDDPARMLDDEVEWSGTLASMDAKEIDRVLLAVFEQFFDCAGQTRPDRLYGFPGAEPGIMPRG